jgi:hypothetical protein
MIIQIKIHTSTKVKSHPVFFFPQLLFLFLRMTEVEPEMLFFLVIFHYGLDHGLQFESYLKLNECMAKPYCTDLLSSEYNHHSYAKTCSTN